MTKNSRDNVGATTEPSCPPVQNSLVNAALSPLVSKLLDKDLLLRLTGADPNSETSHNSSKISIRFSKKATEDSEDESNTVLAINMPPPAEPVPTEGELSDAV